MEVISLRDYLKAHPWQGPLRPVPHYFETGDFIMYYFKDVPHYAKQINGWLTIYLNISTNEIVGCKICGVKALLRPKQSV